MFLTSGNMAGQTAWHNHFLEDRMLMNVEFSMVKDRILRNLPRRSRFLELALFFNGNIIIFFFKSGTVRESDAEPISWYDAVLAA